MKKLFVLVAILFIAGVASAQDPHPVRLTVNSNAVDGCTFVEEVTSNANVNWGQRHSAGVLTYLENRAAYRLRARALDLQCDFVLVTTTVAQSTSMGASVVYRGEAYDCGGIGG
jgi:hypothetical protein